MNKLCRGIYKFVCFFDFVSTFQIIVCTRFPLNYHYSVDINIILRCRVFKCLKRFLTFSKCRKSIRSKKNSSAQPTILIKNLSVLLVNSFSGNLLSMTNKSLTTAFPNTKIREVIYLYCWPMPKYA